MLHSTFINELDHLLQIQNLCFLKRKKVSKKPDSHAQLPPILITEID